MDKILEKVGAVTVDLTDYTGQDRYSDGDEEEMLLALAEKCTPGDTDAVCMAHPGWTVQYHFSSLRENILHWYPIGKTDRVLEIGAGCGAVTRTIAQRAGNVTCVDLSYRRSLINARRNRDLDNLTIHVGNFMDTAPHLPGPFDVITLIGVFEYGMLYIEGEDPFVRFLQTIKGLLAKDGVLLIAIENRLGLKYFAGCREDHTGVFFEGIEGYRDETKVRTFSRPELIPLLQKSGFDDYAFFYPYPDYKFPSAVYSDRSLPKAGQLHENMQNFDRDRMLLFDESKVFDSLIGTGLFPVFSNSFFIEAGKPRRTPVYVKFSNERKKDFAIRTEIGEEGGLKYVIKRAQTAEAKEHIRALGKHEADLNRIFRESVFRANALSMTEEGAAFEYLEGETVEEALDRLLPYPERLRDGLKEITDRIAALSDCMFEESEGFMNVFGSARGYEGPAVSTADIDLLLSNMILTGDTLQVIDYEWTFDFPVPVAFLNWRLLHYYLLGNSKRLYLSAEEYLSMAGISMKERDLFADWERSFQLYVIGDTLPRSMLYEERGAGTYDVEGILGRYMLHGDALPVLDRANDAERLLADRTNTGKTIAGYRSERLLRKKRKLQGKEDPFRRFDPDLPSDPAGLCFCLDGTAYGLHGLTVRGWCFDRSFAAFPSITDDGEHPVPCEVRREARADVSAVFGRPSGEENGFIIRIPEEELGKRLFLRISSLRGHGALDLHVITDPGERERARYTGHESIPAEAYAEYLKKPDQEKGHSDPVSEELMAAFAADFAMTDLPGCAWEEDAAAVFAEAAAQHPDAQVLYCDDDLRGEDGRRTDPRFKPDYSKTYLLSAQYIGGAFAVRKELLSAAGSKMPETEGELYGFLLRVSEKTDRFYHIPKVLFHRSRKETGFPVQELAGACAELQSHYEREGIAAQAEADEMYGILHTRYIVSGDPLVTVLIPNKDHTDDLARCLASCAAAAEGIRCEYIIIENNSEKEETFAYYETLRGRDDVRILTYQGVFNYAAINNFGASYANGDLLLLLNNDTEWITKGGIARMAAAVLQDGAGAAGARMYYEDDTIQHAGVVIGYGGIAGHCFQGQDRLDPGYMKRIAAPQELSAVTGACLMVRKALFDSLGGFAPALAVALNDVDLCLRIRQAGYKVLYIPEAELYHYESRSRGYEDNVVKLKRFEREKGIFRARWAALLASGDPYYNPNLTKRLPDFSLPSGEEER